MDNSNLDNYAKNQDTVITFQSVRLLEENIKFLNNKSNLNTSNEKNIIDNIFDQEDVLYKNNISICCDEDCSKRIYKICIGLFCYTLFGLICILLIILFLNLSK
ncbi:hypothetical protein NAPIS_ORF01905 [Vairimorpha apis BRL 01]|uniref:Uncharacterized protein n=1 Tax=Vairimorpha apis BRL 01 TaxID=1037528 RepID=T0MBG6_9MICR|nr:hypothetical protein NAPIS_ORF01905 [Vairimorpha apis BRL 01]